MTISNPNPTTAPVFADMLLTMAGLAADLVCEHKAVHFMLSFGSKSMLVLGAQIPTSEVNAVDVVKAIGKKAALHGYKVDGDAGAESASPYGTIRQLAFSMRHVVDEPAVH